MGADAAPLSKLERRALETLAAAPYGFANAGERTGIRIAALRQLAERGYVELLRDEVQRRLGGGWGGASYGSPVTDQRVWVARITDVGRQALTEAPTAPGGQSTGSGDR